MNNMAENNCPQSSGHNGINKGEQGTAESIYDINEDTILFDSADFNASSDNCSDDPEEYIEDTEVVYSERDKDGTSVRKAVEPGVLYIVATPIGNSRDMSPRGKQILEECDLIAAEDTRRSMVLLNKLGIRNRLASNHKFNEYGKARHFISELSEGKSIAVITDAGTPCISDPGNELIKAAVEEGIKVVGVPGCCAAVTALSISGFDLSSFLFYGFFPRENADRKKLLEKMRRADTRTFAFYESPLRIMSLVDYFVEVGADLRMCLCNDLTKLHELCFRGSPMDVKQQLMNKGNYEKGEYCVIVELGEGYAVTKVEHTVSAEALLMDAMVSGCRTVKEAVVTVLTDLNNTYSKNELKAAAINMKKLISG